MLFSIFSAKSQNNIVQYEYWIHNYNAKSIATRILTTPSEFLNILDKITLPILTKGIHSVNYRFKDNTGHWSSVLTQYFQHFPNTTVSDNIITSYEYWIDNYKNKKYNTLTSQSNFIIFDTSFTKQLSTGIHNFNIRYKDKLDNGEVFLTQYLLNIPNTTVSNNIITSYEYWIENTPPNNILNIYFKVTI